MARDASHLHFEHLPIAGDSALALLPAEVAERFRATFGSPTRAQRFAWPAVRSGEHLLLSAPTGSGKTLAAFLPILTAPPSPGLKCLYLAPLKSLARDIQTNLSAHQEALGLVPWRIAGRTGDTSSGHRRQQKLKPPDLLLTTPETLAILLTQPAWLEHFRALRFAVIDEIHTLVGQKRGADVALSLERLQTLAPRLQRIGLSATCTPLARAARFLVGSDRPCRVAHVEPHGPMEVGVELVPRPLWIARLARHLTESGATLIFANTRHLAERICWALKRKLPELADSIAVHHGSLGRERRFEVEQDLKAGKLRAVVTSASLDLGIDVGSAESVIFLHPPGGVARFLQRLGRSGHRPGALRRGLILVDSPAEYLEGKVTLGAGRMQQIEPLAESEPPLDVLCQHLVGLAMTGRCHSDEVFDLVRRAEPFREMARADFDGCVRYLSGQKSTGADWLPSRLAWDAGRFAIADDALAQLLRRNLGTIVSEETRSIRLMTPAYPKGLVLGQLDAAFVQNLAPGDRFVLGGRSLELRSEEGRDLLVEEVGANPAIPQWLGGGWDWPADLARRVFLARAHAAEQLREGPGFLARYLRELQRSERLDRAGFGELRDFLQAQETQSEIPSMTSLLIEAVDRDFGIEYAVHTPLPRAANEALAQLVCARLEPRKARHVSSNLGFLVFVESDRGLGEPAWRHLLSLAEWDADLDELLGSSPLVGEHFARVAQTGLMVLRNPLGGRRKVGGRDWAERRLFQQVEAGDPDFVLLRQTRREILAQKMRFDLAHAWLTQMSAFPWQVRWLNETSPIAQTWIATSSSMRVTP